MAKTKAAPKTNGKEKRGPVIRIVAIVDPETKEVRALERVTAEGRVASKRQAKHYGITKPFSSWMEFDTNVWSEASKAFKAGKGRKVTAK